MMNDCELGSGLLRGEPMAAGAARVVDKALARRWRGVRLWTASTLAFWGFLAAALLGLIWYAFGVVGPYADRALPDLEANVFSLREHDFSRMTPGERIAFRTAMAARATCNMVGILAAIVLMLIVLGVANTWLIHTRLRVAFAEVHPDLQQISEELRRLRSDRSIPESPSRP